jgi:hypothetical protein
MIGNIVKAEGIKQPKSSNFSNIKKGDTIVYYAAKDYAIVGIFKVVSDIEYLADDPAWKEIMVYRIIPQEMPLEGQYLDFKKLVKDPKVVFDLFPDKSNWGSYLQGKTCVLLTEKDFLLIKNALVNQVYLRSIQDFRVELTEWQKKHKIETPEAPKGTQVRRHQEAINKWKREEEKRFGGFIKPQIETNQVDINDILPSDIWLEKNKKYLDALSKLDVGGQPFYQSVLEVQHQGSKRRPLCQSKHCSTLCN